MMMRSSENAADAAVLPRTTTTGSLSVRGLGTSSSTSRRPLGKRTNKASSSKSASSKSAKKATKPQNTISSTAITTSSSSTSSSIQHTQKSTTRTTTPPRLASSTTTTTGTISRTHPSPITTPAASVLRRSLRATLGNKTPHSNAQTTPLSLLQKELGPSSRLDIDDPQQPTHEEEEASFLLLSPPPPVSTRIGTNVKTDSTRTGTRKPSATAGARATMIRTTTTRNGSTHPLRTNATATTTTTHRFGFAQRRAQRMQQQQQQQQLPQKELKQQPKQQQQVRETGKEQTVATLTTKLAALTTLPASTQQQQQQDVPSKLVLFNEEPNVSAANPDNTVPLAATGAVTTGTTASTTSNTCTATTTQSPIAVLTTTGAATATTVHQDTTRMNETASAVASALPVAVTHTNQKLEHQDEEEEEASFSAPPTTHTNKKGGVCLDLTELFTSVQSPPPTLKQKQSQPHSSKRHTKSSNANSSSHNHNNPQDDNWAEQQSDTFLQFLNHTILGANAGSTTSTENSPTDATATLAKHQHAAQVQRQARDLYQQQQHIRHLLQEQIASNQLVVRKDKDVRANVALRTTLLEVLNQYQPEWLQLGLETVLGPWAVTANPKEESILASHSKINTTSKKKNRSNTEKKNKVCTALCCTEKKIPPMKKALRNCILHKVLSDEKTLHKYTGGKCQVPSGPLEAKYRAEVSRLALYRLLVLCIFLDGAKQANLLDMPLFWPTATLKSTRQVLLALSRDILHAQGDLIKHLHRSGIDVSYQQQAVDEIDVTLVNLAIDLRDGTRLARLAEIWTKQPKYTLLRKLRLPAVSRLQKLHNVRLVLEQLGHPPTVAAHHIVDGHCARVLQWLWWVVAQHCLDDLLPASQVRAEIYRLERLRPTGLEVSQSNDLKVLLQQWVSAVVRRFGKDVKQWEELTEGSLVALVVHYYHPKLLPLFVLEKHQHNAAQVVNQRLLQLGGIPPLQDSSSLLLFLACLCSRLLVASAHLGAARRIQAAWRLYRETRRRKWAAQVLTKVWKRRKDIYFEQQRNRYQKAVHTLERFVLHYQPILRANKRARATAAVMLQKCWRGAVIRRNFRQNERRQLAAIAIQRIWRGFWAVVEFQIDVLDILTVQSCARRFLCRRDFQRRIQAVKTLQDFFRGRRQRQHRAACTIQSFARSLAARHLFLSLLQSRTNAAVAIQSMVRGFNTRRYVQTLHEKATLIQDLVRAWLSRSNRTLLLEKVVVIQSQWRSHAAHVAFKKQLVETTEAVVLLQRLFRGKVDHKQYLRQQDASRSIQSLWRGYHQERQFVALLKATVRIQSVWRSVLYAKNYQETQEKILVCQSIVRRWLMNRFAVRKMQSIILVQSMIRQWHAGRLLRSVRAEAALQLQAATKIQCHWRAFVCKVQFDCELSDIVLIQSLWRQKTSRKERGLRLNAVDILQSASRNFLASRLLHRLSFYSLNQASLERTASIDIQSFFRGYVVRRELSSLNRSALCIQKAFRGFIARIDYYMDLMDIILIQSAARMWLGRRQRTLRKEAIVRIQSFTRMRQAITAAKNKASREAAATSIQKTWRCYTIHIDFMLSIFAAIDIQAAVRRMLAVRKCEKRKQAVIRLQSFWRRVQAERLVTRIHKSATLIQSLVLMQNCKSHLVLQRAACIQVQRCTRGYLVRLSLELDHFAAREIQKVWRGYTTYIDFACKMLSAVKIQSMVRGMLGRKMGNHARRQKEAEKLLKNRAAVKIQQAYLAFQIQKLHDTAALVIQRAVFRFLAQTKFARICKGVVMLQSVVRAGQIRRRAKSQLKAVMRRAKAANAHSRAEPQMHLGNRTHSALRIICSSKSLSEILCALKVLEMATRLSSVCCVAFSQANASDILFSLVRTCNRSLPHIELLTYILLTMSNVTSHDSLLPCVATEGGVATLLDLVQMFRDKEVVFCLAVSLLYRAVKLSIQLQSLCRSKENMKRLHGVHSLCARKLVLSDSSNASRRPGNVFNKKKKPAGDQWTLSQGSHTLGRLIKLLDPTGRSPRSTRQNRFVLDLKQDY